EEQDKQKIELPVSMAIENSPISLSLNELEQIWEQSPFYSSGISFDSRVNIWFTNPACALIQPKYARFIASEKSKQKIVSNHTFSKTVDQFVGTSYSCKRPWKNTKNGQINTLYLILCRIETKEETKNAVAQFCFDEKNRCYHRYLGEKSNEEFFDQFISRKQSPFADVPEESEIFSEAASSSELLAIGDQGDEIFYHASSKMITIKQKSGTKIILFKPPEDLLQAFDQ
ncbi:MAG: hypothetical protein ACM3JI_01455, partial [Anaerolineae bacterium]